ncbi:MAG: M24 family metallopeptidase, partial [Sulfuricaulis sp.]|nr:M24 family metallopeptidase [Sulfuricaulis sp.]
SHTELVGGKKNSLFADAIEAVRESTFSGVRLAQRAKTGKEVSQHCLAVLKEYGFEKNTFKDAGLAVGHHVGLAVHDGATGLEQARLKPGMAFTVEPGLYFPGKFGVRFEEIVIR